MCDVLVVDNSSICRELLGRILEVQGYSTTWTTPEAAGEMLRRAPAALIILEPGPVGSYGWRVLEELLLGKTGNEPPIVIVSDQAAKEDVLRAARMGVRDYMLKSRFSLPELLVRVRRHVAPSKPRQEGAPASLEHGAPPGIAAGGSPESQASASAAGQIPFRPQLNEKATREALLAAAKELGIVPRTREQTIERMDAAPVKTLPGGVADLIMLVNSPRGTVADVAQILRQDPILTAGVLRVANSAAFISHRPRVPTVEDAVKVIGVSGVRNLVVNVGIFDAFADGGADKMHLSRIWQHCLGVAMLMEKLAPKDDSVPPGSAYLVGLCHDLADIVLRQQFAAEYKDIAALVKHTGYHARHAEALIFGIPYGQLTSHLLTRLHLPPLITVPIEEFFERPRVMSGAGAGSLLGRSLRALNVYGHGLLLAADAEEPITPLTRDECEKTFCDGAMLAPAEDEQIRSDALITASVLAGFNAIQSYEACEQLIPKGTVRICYSVDGEYSKLDPLLSFLRLTTKEVTQAPPLKAMKPPMLDGMNALIVVGPRTGAAEIFQQDLARLRALVSGKSLPVLYLSGYRPPDDKASVGNIAFRQLPLRISELGTFLKNVA